MDILRIRLILIMFVLGSNAYALSIRVPSLGARVVESDAIIIGRFTKCDANDVVMVEKVICGEIAKDEKTTVNVVFRGNSSFPSAVDIGMTLRGRKCIFIGNLSRGNLYLQYGLSSILPNCNGSGCLSDMGDSQALVENLLKYKHKLADVQNVDDLISNLLQDVKCVVGRISVYAFLCEDVGLWKGKDGLRRDIGCVVGAQLMKLNAFDDDSVRFVSTGMTSIPLSLKLRYLQKASLNGSRNRALCEKELLSLLKTLGHQGSEIPVSVIDAFIKRGAVGDMEKCLHLLRSDSLIMRKCASEMLGMISGRSNPEKANNDDEVPYWSRIIEELKGVGDGSEGTSMVDKIKRLKSSDDENSVTNSGVRVNSSAAFDRRLQRRK